LFEKTTYTYITVDSRKREDSSMERRINTIKSCKGRKKEESIETDDIYNIHEYPLYCK